MLIEIGSNFWLGPDENVNKPAPLSPSMFGCSGRDFAWTSSGRSAISLVLQNIEKLSPGIKKSAILPSYTCSTVIEPFKNRGYDIGMYLLDGNLMSDPEDVIEAVERANPGIFLFHRYFGKDTIPHIDTVFPLLRERGVWIIEDCTQGLYSTYPRSDADYFVGSIRKWCGVPDGGFVVSRDSEIRNKPVVTDTILENTMLDAEHLKYDYMFNHKSTKDLFLERFRQAEKIIQGQERIYSISDASVSIQSGLDVEHLKRTRRANYKFLESGLADCPSVHLVFNNLSDDEVPLYCPVLCEDRAAVQGFLRDNSIYAPIVWPKVDCLAVDDRVQYLYDHMLCLPIDQRYGMDEMNLMVCKLNSVR